MKLEKSDLQIESMVSRIQAGEIDLQPNFQRGEIWDTKRRQRLVDTILRGWYVPAVHIVVDSDGGEVVLDGQQRLATIRDFVADELRVDGTIEPSSPMIAELHGKRYSQLPEHMKRAMNRFVLQIITLTDYEPQEPNELFFRLNQSYNLTPPEKRNALHGLARDQVKDLVMDLTGAGLLDRQVVGFSNGRLAYDDIVSRVCVAIELASLRRHINNNVVESFYRTSEFSTDTTEGVRSASHVLLDQIHSGSDRVKFNKGTLQTWLTYCYWAPRAVGALPNGLLRDFEFDRAVVRKGDHRDSVQPSPLLAEVLRIFSDRASYRVTDVSSVLARDLAIHLYSTEQYGTDPHRGSDSLLRRLGQSPTSEIQSDFFEFIEHSHWGDPILSVDLLQ